MNYTGERAIPWNANTGLFVMHPHLMRYAWATRFCWGKRVVDLACGSGYGAYLLSMVAKSVTAVDINREAIDYARLMFAADNLEYVIGDITRDVNTSPDVYVCFEALEHLADPGALVNELTAPLVWSIPVEVTNAWHKQVLSVSQIRELMTPSAFWFQSAQGDIAPMGEAWYPPAYVLGITA